MKPSRTPQDKKRLSYQHDRRDDYGESSKGSRKSVRFRKRWVNQTYRQRIRQALHRADPQSDNSTDLVRAAQRPNWRKASHRPLGLMLLRKGKLPAEKVAKLTFRVGYPVYPLLRSRKSGNNDA